MIHERIPIINVRCHSGQENATRTRANIGIWNYSAKSGILCIIDEGHLSYENARRIAVTIPHSDFPPSILTKCVLQWLRQKVKFYEIFSECICVTGVNLLRHFFSMFVQAVDVGSMHVHLQLYSNTRGQQ